MNDIQCISLRFSGFIDGGGLVDYVIKQALLNKEICLYGNGQINRDYLPSSKAIESIMQALNTTFKKEFSAINIGSGQKISSLEITQHVIKELNSKSKITLLENNLSLGNFVFNIKKAKDLLNFEPCNISNSIKDYVKTFKINANQIY